MKQLIATSNRLKAANLRRVRRRIGELTVTTLRIKRIQPMHVKIANDMEYLDNYNQWKETTSWQHL